MITHTELLKVLDYNPDTGVFLWKFQRSGVYFGKEAGSISIDSGYRKIMIFNISYMAQRLAWFYVTGDWPIKVDHEDHDRANNKFKNLRNVTTAINNKNKSMQKNSTSKVTGVNWHKGNKKWYARISVDNKRIDLGSFDDKEDAKTARRAANIKYGFHENHGF